MLLQQSPIYFLLDAQFIGDPDWEHRQYAEDSFVRVALTINHRCSIQNLVLVFIRLKSCIKTARMRLYGTSTHWWMLHIFTIGKE